MGLYSSMGIPLYSTYSSTGDTVSVIYDKQGLVKFPYNLCIMSFNPQWFTRINSQENMLRDIFYKNNADIIGFQEASKTNTLPVIGENILNMLYPYSLIFNHYNYLAVKSKYELMDVTMSDYVSQDPNMNETRGYIKAYFELDGNLICFIVTHLELNETYRNAQMAELFAVAENEEYVIITGDFNTVSDQLDSDDYRNMYKQYVDAGYHLANCSNRFGFVKTYSNGATAESLEDFRSACDGIIVSPNIEIISRVVDTTKLHYLNGDYIDHCPIIAYLNIKPSFEVWNITNLLTNCTSSNHRTYAAKNSSYKATIMPNPGYTITGATVSITMGGVDITSTAYSNGVISIDSVTGNLVISVNVITPTVSISAIYTQSEPVYKYDSIDSLKANLVVTATWPDSSTTVIPSTEYTLIGTLTVGTSPITVMYQDVKTTFDVDVADYFDRHSVVFPDRTMDVLNGYTGDQKVVSGVNQYILEPHSGFAFLLSNYGEKTVRYSDGSFGTKYYVPVPEDATSVTIQMQPTTLSAYLSFFNNYDDSDGGHHFYRRQDSGGFVNSGATVTFAHRNKQYLGVSLLKSNSENVDSVTLTFNTN